MAKQAGVVKKTEDTVVDAAEARMVYAAKFRVVHAEGEGKRKGWEICIFLQLKNSSKN